MVTIDKKLPGLKIENPFLKDVNAQSLQGMTKRVDSAFKRFFREKKVFLSLSLKRILFKLSLCHSTIQ